MRKVIYFVAASVDGYIADRNGGIDWLFDDFDFDNDPVYQSLMQRVDTVVMGRKTYDVAMSFGEYPYQGMDGYVFSRANAGEFTDFVKFIDDKPDQFIKGLQAEKGKDVWFLGGAELAQEFLEKDLIDEFVIGQHPVALGGGVPLWPEGFDPIELNLLNTVHYDNGLVMLHYTRRR